MSRQDRVYKDYTSNPIPTSFFSMIVLCIPRLWYERVALEKKRCRDGVTCVVLVYPVYYCTRKVHKQV